MPAQDLNWKENSISASIDSDLRCFFLHHGDPYLRLGPLHYEPLSASPHVAILRNGDLFCDSDLEFSWADLVEFFTPNKNQFKITGPFYLH